MLRHNKCETYAGEEQSPQWGIDDVQDPVTDEDAENGEEQQHNQAHEQHPPTGSEVILALWEKKKKNSLKIIPKTLSVNDWLNLIT